MDSSDLMAFESNDHSIERRSFSMVLPLKRVAEEEGAAAATALPAVKRACSDLNYESAVISLETELKQEPVKCVNEGTAMGSSPPQIQWAYTSFLDQLAYGHEISYKKLYLAFKETERMFLHTHAKIYDDLEGLRRNSINWKDIPEEISVILTNKLRLAFTFLRFHGMFEKWLSKSIDLILAKSMTMNDVLEFLRNCDVEECPDVGSYPFPDLRWLLNLLRSTEIPWTSKRAKEHAWMFELAFKKFINRETYERLTEYRRNCIHHPFFDGYDPNKRFENCKEDCLSCRKLLPILRTHSDFLNWLDNGTSETHEFITHSLNLNCSLNSKSFMDVPDKFICDCKLLFDLPKELIRDCIVDTIMVKRKEVEAGKELEVFHHIVNHECVEASTQNGLFSCKEFVGEVPDYIFEYSIMFYRKYSNDLVGQELINYFDEALCEQIKEYKSCVCYYYGMYDGLDYDVLEQD
ncbi:hypothetical protein AXF42_Ash018100 [Apostasia shenzhenica]|uniref:Uncharacterized protein n=1 Tax=Apostasia shenzhenica TaxID=1088818 RepID=A0A2I0AVR3_9ASPA|nr:hypothetical protein AXF42_Ash018100 [Apostasia shenzhenica]